MWAIFEFFFKRFESKIRPQHLRENAISSPAPFLFLHKTYLYRKFWKIFTWFLGKIAIILVFEFHDGKEILMSNNIAVIVMSGSPDKSCNESSREMERAVRASFQ